MKIKYIASLALLIAILVSTTALAHAFSDHSEPRVGSVIDKPPTEVRIWFTQEIEPAFSKIEVFGPDGKQVDKKDSHTDRADKRLLIVSLPVLPPGVYAVHWTVVSVDTHRTHNDFKFTLKPR